MESGGGASGGGGGGAGGDGGHLCHACGFKYASAHPSAKQRRAHRKNCKPLPSAAAAAEEDEIGSGLTNGRKLLLGEGEGERGGGEGSGAGASDCGGGFSGSAQDVGNAVADECNAEHSSPNGAGIQVIINGSIEEIPSEVTPKANESETQTEMATELSESAPYNEDSHTSQSGISFEQHPDASASHRPLDPEEDASFSPELSADEINKLADVSLAPNAAGAEIPAQTNTIVGSSGDDAFTEVDCMATAVHKDQICDEVKGSVIDSSYQEKPETGIAGGQNVTAMEADPSVHNLSVVYKEEIPSEDTEPKEQNRVILTGSIEQVCTIKEEPANLIGNEESCTEKHVCADDTNGDDLFELGSGDSQLEIADAIKPQQETDYSSVTAEHPIFKQEGQPCPDPDEVIKVVPNPTGPFVVAEVISAGSDANLTKNDYSSEVTIGKVIQHNASHTDAITSMPPEVDRAELSSYSSSHEIDTVDSNVETRQNQNISADLTFHEMNEVHGIDAEKKLWKEDISAYTSSHETNAACSRGDFGEQRHNEGIIAEASSDETSILHGANDLEEVIAKPASEKIDVMTSGDISGEKNQSELDAETTYESNMACSIEHVEEKEDQTEEITADPTNEISAVNIPSNIELKHNEEITKHPIACEVNVANVNDNVEGQKRNEESATDCTPHSISVIPSLDEKDKIQTEDMTTQSPSSHDVVMVHDTGNVTEKSEDTVAGPTSFKIDALSTTSSVQEKQTEEITVGPTSQGIDVLPTVDAVEEKKNEEHTTDPISGKIDAEGNTDGIEDKRPNGEITVDSSSHENNTPQGTDNAGGMKQDEEAAADPASDKFIPAQSTDDTEEKKPKEETAASEIDTTQSAKDDQGEEITDKEMTINSDKNHVSLKALLSEKGMEVKEKKASSTKERVLSFRRKSSKDSVSPGKPGSGQQDWNSPARLPVEKSPKGKKQQWMPFICCPSIK